MPMAAIAPRPGRARIVSGLVLLAYSGAALAPLAAIYLLSSAEGGSGLGPALLEPRMLRSIAFTLKQSAASTLAALAIGIPGAALVARYRFPGRRALKALSVLPFSVPSVLVVLAFALFYGRAGHLNRFLMAIFGLSEPPIDFLYGFWGIVLVHGFYEFPVVLQTVGEVWERLPREREQAATLLGARRFRAFLTGSLPSLAPSIAQAAALCFLLCFFSFAVVMVFGGLAGTTMEVEVYRRSRIEADARGAALVALVETAIALGAVGLLALCERSAASGSARAPSAGNPVELRRPRGAALLALLAYALFLAVFFLGPMLSLAAQAFTVRSGPLGPGRPGLGNFARLFSGLPGSSAASSPFLAALRATALTAIPAALAAAFFGAAGAFALRRAGGAAKALASLPLAVSGIVASLGWSLILPRGDSALIPLVQALCAMPYVLRSLAAALSTLEASPAEAARTLGAGRLAAAALELRAIAPSLLSALAFAFAASAGEMNAALALGQGGFETVPVYLYRLTSAHRFPEACAAGLVLAALTATAFAAKEGRGSRA